MKIIPEGITLQPERKFSTTLIKLTVAVSLHVFIILKFEAILVDRIGLIADKKTQSILYSVAIAILGIGYILFPISKAFLRNKDEKTGYLKVVVLSSISFLFFISVTIISSIVPMIAFSAFFAALNLGYLGSWMLWSMSVFLNGTHCSGRTIGASILAATIALNYSSILIDSDVITILAIASFTIAFVVIINHLHSNKLSHPPNNENYETLVLRKGLLYVITIALLTVLYGIANGLLLQVHSTDKAYSMQFYQLIHGVSALVFGAMYDFRKKAYPRWIYTLLIIIFAFSPFVLSFPSGSLYGVIVGIYAGLFCLIYLMLFIDLAPRTRFPELWASCGAIVRYLVTGIVIIPTVLLVEFVNIYSLVLINIIIAALIYKTLSSENDKVDILPNPGNNDKFGNNAHNENKSSLCEDPENDVFTSYTKSISYITSDENQLYNIAKYAVKHKLTQTETKALLYIVSSEESMKIISGKENISERTFQRYLTRIYEKTGTKTRAGLVSSYLKNFSNESAGNNSEI